MIDNADRLIAHAIEKFGKKDAQDRVNICLAVAPLGFTALSDQIEAFFYWASTDEFVAMQTRIEKMVRDGIQSISL
jgi:hypothetical protein